MVMLASVTKTKRYDHYQVHGSFGFEFGILGIRILLKVAEPKKLNHNSTLHKRELPNALCGKLAFK